MEVIENLISKFRGKRPTSRGCPKFFKLSFQIFDFVCVNYDDVENEKAPQKKKRHPLSDGAGSNYMAR